MSAFRSLDEGTYEYETDIEVKFKTQTQIDEVEFREKFPLHIQKSLKISARKEQITVNYSDFLTSFTRANSLEKETAIAYFTARVKSFVRDYTDHPKISFKRMIPKTWKYERYGDDRKGVRKFKIELEVVIQKKDLIIKNDEESSEKFEKCKQALKKYNISSCSLKNDQLIAKDSYTLTAISQNRTHALDKEKIKQDTEKSLDKLLGALVKNYKIEMQFLNPIYWENPKHKKAL